ncbi:MAG: RNA methyltransferase [Calditrichia bacterium]|nr:RNA methyltransferase [Calditrichia bacterium]
MYSIISELSQAKIKALNKLKLKKYRYESKEYLCEGFRLFSAALASNSKNILEVILNESFIDSPNHFEVFSFCKKSKISVYKCTDKLFKSLSDEKSPSGILFVMSLNYFQNSDVSNITSNQCIFLENISDPGNLGTIIRSAAWFGVEHILISPSSVDPFNPKVVRATAGGIFIVKLYLDVDLDIISNFGINKDYECIGTTVDKGIQLSNWKVSDKNIIFFGNEANGLTNSATQLLNKKITITGAGKLESLNLSVTTGIILNHLYQAKNIKN